MNLWRLIRIPFLAATLSSSLLVLGQGIFAPPQMKRANMKPTQFPATVSLLGWQFVGSIYLKEKVEAFAAKKATPKEGRQYRYTRNGKLLKVEMHSESSNNARENLSYYAKVVPSSLEVRWQKGTGYYGLFSDRQQAYLSACINFRGNSTFTVAQHRQNQILYNLDWHRFLPWLFGQERLLDIRCTWAYLSIPLEGSAPEVAYQILEEVWPRWHHSWQSRFFSPIQSENKTSSPEQKL